MAISKVVYDGNTLVDLTSDTATEEDVFVGKTFHLSNGNSGTGTLKNAKLGIGGGDCATSTTTVGGTRYATVTDYELVEGGIIAIFFDYDVPASSYLNVNSKGAKRIMYGNQVLTGDEIRAKDLAFFMYFGNYYHLLGVNRSVTLITNSELTTLETKLGL